MNVTNEPIYVVSENLIKLCDKIPVINQRVKWPAKINIIF